MGFFANDLVRPSVAVPAASLGVVDQARLETRVRFGDRLGESLMQPLLTATDVDERPLRPGQSMEHDVCIDETMIGDRLRDHRDLRRVHAQTLGDDVAQLGPFHRVLVVALRRGDALQVSRDGIEQLEVEFIGHVADSSVNGLNWQRQASRDVAQPKGCTLSERGSSGCSGCTDRLGEDDHVTEERPILDI